ncbi:MAG: hypothetical protein HOC71_11720 [Candidatus Latescibacteria bacterium]|jgi:hypothetical protein|nr:hypothetical protein [Candidatus Latescibacterota bacterium]
MIELSTATRSNRFTYNKEAQRNKENQEAEFSGFAKNADLTPADSHEIYTGMEKKVDEMVMVSDMEMTIYTFAGKKTVFEKFTGGTIDFEI